MISQRLKWHADDEAHTVVGGRLGPFLQAVVIETKHCGGATHMAAAPADRVGASVTLTKAIRSEGLYLEASESTSAKYSPGRAGSCSGQLHGIAPPDSPAPHDRCINPDVPRVFLNCGAEHSRVLGQAALAKRRHDATGTRPVDRQHDVT